MELFDFAVAVTAASSNHFEEFEHNIRNFSHRFPRVKVFFYDIGLEELQVIAVKKLPFVMYRKFNFAAYPNHVQNLLNYAWKLLIIQELISEYDGVMWFDSSIVFTRDVSHFIPLMFTAKSGILFYLQIYSRMHSIRAATHPQMIKYFPASEDGLLSDMLPGGCILVLNTADVQQHILPWTTLCALHKNCIQPTGANKDCPRRIWGLPRNQYANCHRFDQALFSLVVGNLYGFELSRYRLNRTEAPAHVAHLLK
ncbi:predicted protein [Nematostella vectensis]|uniref:Nucleotide-diphospho-sugar transferase domain-containing protein n=1 Tax=Nematostella vectensis TaxID=45351 RepID=A7SBP6_NEMVE|nr:predicted protein [Nematostella vectensis]|eukprot:XP_001630941.1 predicted protein [Nematostella vectensis]